MYHKRGPAMPRYKTGVDWWPKFGAPLDLTGSKKKRSEEFKLLPSQLDKDIYTEKQSHYSQTKKILFHFLLQSIISFYLSFGSGFIAVTWSLSHLDQEVFFIGNNKTVAACASEPTPLSTSSHSSAIWTFTPSCKNIASLTSIWFSNWSLGNLQLVRHWC